MVELGAFDRQLRFAIAHRRLIEVRYGGRLRVAEPHDYGLKNGASQRHFTWDALFARVG